MPIPSSFETVFSAGTVPALQGLFGETVTIAAPSAEAASVQAIVNRQPLERAGSNGLIVRYGIEVTFSRDDVSAIGVGYTVTLRKRQGDASDTTYQVAEILDQNGGCWIVGLA